MKTYITNILNRYKRYSENQDVKTAICNRSWWVFNDCGEKELYIFQEDNTLIISLSGRVTKGTWEYVPTNRSLIITAKNESYMLHLAFMDNVLFALQVDGTQKYSFMIDENNRASFKPKTLRELQCYFEEKEQAKLLEERQIQNRLEWERQEAERQRLRRIEQERREAERQRIEQERLEEKRRYEKKLNDTIEKAWMDSGGKILKSKIDKMVSFEPYLCGGCLIFIILTLFISFQMHDSFEVIWFLGFSTILIIFYYGYARDKMSRKYYTRRKSFYINYFNKHNIDKESQENIIKLAGLQYIY